LKSLGRLAKKQESMTVQKNPAKNLSYKRAGVDIRKGDALVDWLIDEQGKAPQKSAKETGPRDGVVSGIGGFAALYRASFDGMKSPLLVSSTDGVGTKVKLAVQFKNYSGIGQDLVAMCVNDIACVGARPLFFLDYYACAQLDMKAAQSFLKSVKKACEASGCVLIGGETAEMPGVYSKKDFDCAGFAVGVVAEDDVLGASRVRMGDKIIGVASSGFHSNGYSLLRKVFARDAKKWADKLLTPTHLYSPLVQTVLHESSGLHAVAHVTGGGLDNLLRVVPSNSILDLKAWPVPHEFLEVKKRAKLNWPEMLRTLNCGIGLTLFVAAEEAAAISRVVKQAGFTAYDLGVVQPGNVAKEAVWQLPFNELG